VEFEDALFKFTTAQAPVTAFIGAAPQATRFFKLKAPQGTKAPFSVMTRDGAPRQNLPCGVDGAVRLSFRIDHYAKDWATMAALAKAFRRSLNPELVTYPVWMGDGDSPTVAVKVKAAALENEFDLDDPEPGLLRRVQLWQFWIHEP
jgi:hypothetical protein